MESKLQVTEDIIRGFHFRGLNSERPPSLLTQYILGMRPDYHPSMDDPSIELQYPPSPATQMKTVFAVVTNSLRASQIYLNHGHQPELASNEDAIRAFNQMLGWFNGLLFAHARTTRRIRNGSGITFLTLLERDNSQPDFDELFYSDMDAVENNFEGLVRRYINNTLSKRPKIGMLHAVQPDGGQYIAVSDFSQISQSSLWCVDMIGLNLDRAVGNGPEFEPQCTLVRSQIGTFAA